MKITVTEKQDIIHDQTVRFYNLEGVPQCFPEIPGLTAKACLYIIENTESDRITFPQYIDGEWGEVLYERGYNDFHYTDYDGVKAIVHQRVWQRVS